MKRLAFAACFVLLLANRPVIAQEGQHQTEAQRLAEAKDETEHGSLLFWGWLNFLLLAGGLGYVIKKNAGPYFVQRSLEIRKGMAEAEAARAASDAKVAEVDARLANLQGEIEAVRLNAQREAEADAERVRQGAAAETAKIQSHIAEEIASATKSAKLELRRYSTNLALGLAERKIAARMSPEAQDGLVKSFVATLANAGSGVQGN
jgi:F-type H+-transporting ATPase subunit b